MLFPAENWAGMQREDKAEVGEEVATAATVVSAVIVASVASAAFEEVALVAASGAAAAAEVGDMAGGDRGKAFCATSQKKSQLIEWAEQTEKARRALVVGPSAPIGMNEVEGESS